MLNFAVFFEIDDFEHRKRNIIYIICIEAKHVVS